MGIASDDNELLALEVIHRYVEILDRYFGNVCELDLYVDLLTSIFNFQKAYQIFDELIIAGELQETSKKSVLRVVTQGDAMEDAEQGEEVCIPAHPGTRPYWQPVWLVHGLDQPAREFIVHNRGVRRDHR